MLVLLGKTPCRSMEPVNKAEVMSEVKYNYSLMSTFICIFCLGLDAILSESCP